MAEVTLEGVTKIFPGGTVAVDHVDLEIADGELLVLVGPSGSGKTTVLRLTAGLEELSEGEIRIGERDAWGRGFGTEAVGLLVRRAFDGLGLDRVELQVFATNARAIRAYEKAGFEVERRRPDAAFVGGRYVDVLVMAPLRS